MLTERLRAEPLAYLPALVALALAGISLPARSQARLISLCSGGQAPIRGQRPDCDLACHAGCTRKRPGGSGGR
jgi:hypothetical protein